MGVTMASLPPSFRAVVIGASGAIGSALVGLLEKDPRCGRVTGLHRGSHPPVDFDDDASVARAAAALAAEGPLHLVVNAAGILHTESFGPEKRLEDLDAQRLLTVLRVNTVGPALVLRHFVPLLARDRALLAMLSAKVGSIADNRLGGWYGYRASKAALNMLVKTASIETRRRNPAAVLVALHPGTVASRLSRPFRGDEIGRPAELAAADLLSVLDARTAEDSGGFFSYSGEALPW